MRRSPRTTLLALTFAALAAAAAGCGASEIDADEVPGAAPALVVPTDSELGASGSSADESSSSTDEGADADAPADTGADELGHACCSAGGHERRHRGSRDADRPAAPEETAPEEEPPPAGSAPEQFESFCEQNAGAC